MKQFHRNLNLGFYESERCARHCSKKLDIPFMMNTAECMGECVRFLLLLKIWLYNPTSWILTYVGH
jgi:hypothetical protein